MTRPLPFTQAGLRRAMKAARKEGLHVTGIRPDGTLIVTDDVHSGQDHDLALIVSDGQPIAPSKWEDIEA